MRRGRCGNIEFSGSCQHDCVRNRDRCSGSLRKSIASKLLAFGTNNIRNDNILMNKINNNSFLSTSRRTLNFIKHELVNKSKFSNELIVDAGCSRLWSEMAHRTVRKILGLDSIKQPQQFLYSRNNRVSFWFFNYFTIASKLKNRSRITK